MALACDRFYLLDDPDNPVGVGLSEIRREIGMLFQGGALFDSKTVEQNVMFPLDILTKMPREERLDRCRAGLAPSCRASRAL